MAKMICPQCGADIPLGKLTCEICGASIASDFELCPDCGSQIRKGALFCVECGAKVNDPPSPAGDFSFIADVKDAPSAPDLPAEPADAAPAAPEVSPAPQPEPIFNAASPQPENIPENIPEKIPEKAAPEKTPPAYMPHPTASAGAMPQPNVYTAPRGRTPPPPQPEFSAPPAGFVRSTRPPKGSRYAPLSAWGFVGTILLFSIPVLGWIFCIVWACGGCTKVNKQNLARAYILIFVLTLLVAVVTGVLLYFFAGSWIEPVLKALRLA